MKTISFFLRWAIPAVVFFFQPLYSGIGVATTGAMVGAWTIGLNPFYQIRTFSPFDQNLELRGVIGLEDHFEVRFNAAALSGNAFGYAGSWVFPRFDFDDNNILGLQVGLNPQGQWFAAPQFNKFQDPKGPFAWELDLRVPVTLNAVTFEANFTPNVQLENGAAVFLEADSLARILPTFYASLRLRPGYSFLAFGNGLRVSLSLDGIQWMNGPLAFQPGFTARVQTTVHLGKLFKIKDWDKKKKSSRFGDGGTDATSAPAEDAGGSGKKKKGAAPKTAPKAENSQEGATDDAIKQSLKTGVKKVGSKPAAAEGAKSDAGQDEN